MTIEPISLATVDDAVGLLERAFEEMEYRRSFYTFSKETAHTMLLLNAETTFVCPGGVAGFLLAPSVMDFDDVSAVEYCWHSDPLIASSITRGRIMCALLDAMEDKARALKVPRLIVSSSVKFESAGRLLSGRGFHATEKTFLKGYGHGSC